MALKIGLVFPGQGSQSVGMGKLLYDAYPSLKSVYDEASSVVGYDVAALCFAGPAARLNLTEYTQPALLVSSIAAFTLLEPVGLTPVAVAGHSLGEYSALVAVGGLAFRDAVGLVEKDVARHQDRVREEARRDELPPVGLVLELGHPAELPVARDGREQPGRLRVRGDMALAERRRPVRVETGREQHRRQVERAHPQVVGVVLDRDRVQVDDAEEAVAALLSGGVLPEAADEVAEVLVARGLDAGEDPHARSILVRAGYEKGL